MEAYSGGDTAAGADELNDPRLEERLVNELKAQGVFDQFRKDCLADVDTKVCSSGQAVWPFLYFCILICSLLRYFILLALVEASSSKTEFFKINISDGIYRVSSSVDTTGYNVLTELHGMHCRSDRT